jgi:hypothetical protein
MAFKQAFLLFSCLLTLRVVNAGLNYTFPDCTSGVLKNNTVCDTSKDPATRAKALVALFTDSELIANTVNLSPGVQRLGLPSYQWWSEALVRSTKCSIDMTNG